MTPTDLIARLEEATNSQFVLDQLIAEVVGAPSNPPRAYTASVDAALSLVPEGVQRKVGTDSDGKCYARVGGPRFAEAATEPLALCIAALKARETKGD